MSSYDLLHSLEKIKEKDTLDKQLGTKAPTNTNPEEWSKAYDLDNRDKTGALQELADAKKAVEQEKQQRNPEDQTSPKKDGDDREL